MIGARLYYSSNQKFWQLWFKPLWKVSLSCTFGLSVVGAVELQPTLFGNYTVYAYVRDIISGKTISDFKKLVAVGDAPNSTNSLIDKFFHSKCCNFKKMYSEREITIFRGILVDRLWCTRILRPSRKLIIFLIIFINRYYFVYNLKK